MILQLLTLAWISCQYLMIHSDLIGPRHPLTIFLIVSAFHVIIYLSYRIFVYPFYFSSLRRLPTKARDSIIFGSRGESMKAERGAAHLKWAEEIKHNGLIRVFDVFGYEMLLCVGTTALRELLSTRCFDFQKPKALSDASAMFLGHGVRVVEGSEYEVSYYDYEVSAGTTHAEIDPIHTMCAY